MEIEFLCTISTLLKVSYLKEAEGRDGELVSKTDSQLVGLCPVASLSAGVAKKPIDDMAC